MTKGKFFLMAAIGALVLTGCDAASTTVIETYHLTETDRSYTYAPQELQVNNRVINLFIYDDAGDTVCETKQITHFVSPANAHDAKIKYVSANPAVASVDENGLVTAVSGGDTTITVSCADYPNVAPTVIPVHIIQEVQSGTVMDQKMEDMLAYQEANIPVVTRFQQHRYIESYTAVVKNPEDDEADWIIVPVNGYSEYAEYEMDLDEGYFAIIGDERSLKVEDGNEALVKFGWLFVDDEYYDTHIYHISGTTKTRLDLPTQSYIGKDRIQTVYDLLGIMFTSGSDIAKNSLDSALSTSDLGEDYSKYKSLITKTGANDDGCVSYDLEQLNYETKIAPDKETYYEILANTSVKQDYKQRIVWKDGYVVGTDIYQAMKYVDERDGLTYVQYLTLNYTYDVNEQTNIVLPVSSEYTPVSDLYEL